MKAKITINVELSNLEESDAQAGRLTEMIERVFRLSIPQKHTPKVKSSVEWMPE